MIFGIGYLIKKGTLTRTVGNAYDWFDRVTEQGDGGPTHFSWSEDRKTHGTHQYVVVPQMSLCLGSRSATTDSLARPSNTNRRRWILRNQGELWAQAVNICLHLEAETLPGANQVYIFIPKTWGFFANTLSTYTPTQAVRHGRCSRVTNHNTIPSVLVRARRN